MKQSPAPRLTPTLTGFGAIQRGASFACCMTCIRAERDDDAASGVGDLGQRTAAVKNLPAEKHLGLDAVHDQHIDRVEQFPRCRASRRCVQDHSGLCHGKGSASRLAG